jgi:hypothetical protein
MIISKRIEGAGIIAKQQFNENGMFAVGDIHGLYSKEILIVKIATQKGCWSHQSSVFF